MWLCLVEQHIVDLTGTVFVVVFRILQKYLDILKILGHPRKWLSRSEMLVLPG